MWTPVSITLVCSIGFTAPIFELHPAPHEWGGKQNCQEGNADCDICWNPSCTDTSRSTSCNPNSKHRGNLAPREHIRRLFLFGFTSKQDPIGRVPSMKERVPYMGVFFGRGPSKIVVVLLGSLNNHQTRGTPPSCAPLNLAPSNGSSINVGPKVK